MEDATRTLVTPYRCHDVRVGSKHFFHNTRELDKTYMWMHTMFPCLSMHLSLLLRCGIRTRSNYHHRSNSLRSNVIIIHLNAFHVS